MFQKIKKFDLKLFLLKLAVLSGLLLFIFSSFSVNAQPTTSTPANCSSSSTSTSDLNLLPCYKDLFDFLNKGVLQGFLLPLAPIVGVLAIVWGGYQYYFGSFTGKSDGLNAIKSGVTGLVVYSGYKIIADISGPEQKGLIFDVFKGNVISVTPIINLIQNVFLNDFLYGISGLVAVLAMVYGGYQYISSPLNKEAGLKTIQNAVTGLIIILLSKAAADLILGTFANNTISKEPFINLAKNVISNFLLPVSSVVTLGFIVLAGYQWITSQGDSRKVEDAKNNLRNAVIGFVIVLLSFSVTQLIIYLVTNFKIGQ